MNKILIMDLAFLVIFCIAIVLFLFKNKKNLSREGMIYYYRTKLGMEAIGKFSKKYSVILRKLKYVVIILGFILMISIVSLLALNAYAYIKSPKQIIEATNGAPPIAPLIPYFPQLFGMESFFPNFYFSYFLIALAIVALVHEFSHGIFMRTFGVKIKSTGFIFLGPILGAFVEEDRNNFQKKKNSEQMAILGAGVFANIIFAILFFLILLIFFSVSYVPSGYVFSSYVQTQINTSTINGFENFSSDLVRVKTNSSDFFISTNLYNLLGSNKTLLTDHILTVYMDYPAINSGLRGAITELNGIIITDSDSFQKEISKNYPNDSIIIKTFYNGSQEKYNITLSTNPSNSSKGFLGIGHFVQSPKRNSLVSKFVSFLNFKDPTTFYSARYNSEVAEYFYYLFWWIALINLFVGLFNMLPLGILDGGRFTYLFILSITKSKKNSEKIYKVILSTVGLIFLLIVFGWLFAKFVK